MCSSVSCRLRSSSAKQYFAFNNVSQSEAISQSYAWHRIKPERLRVSTRAGRTYRLLAAGCQTMQPLWDWPSFVECASGVLCARCQTDFYKHNATRADQRENNWSYQVYIHVTVWHVSSMKPSHVPCIVSLSPQSQYLDFITRLFSYRPNHWSWYLDFTFFFLSSLEIFPFNPYTI